MARTGRRETGPMETAPTAAALKAMATAPKATEQTVATARTAPTRTEPTAVTSAGFPYLGRLVGDDAVSDFRQSFLGQGAFRRPLADGEASRLFSWARLNRVLAEHRLGPPRLKLEKAGQDLSRTVFRERRPRPNQLLHD